MPSVIPTFLHKLPQQVRLDMLDLQEALAVVMDMTPMKSSPWWQTSTGAGLLSTALKGLRPVLPEAFGKYLPA